MTAVLAPLMVDLQERPGSAMGDAELRARLEQEHADAFGWAVACCRNDRETAEDVMQTAYLSVLEGRARYEGRSSFRTWLFGVIRLTAASHRRRSFVRELLLSRNGTHLSSAEPRRADADVEVESRNAELRRVLNALPVRQREVLHLVFYHELTVDEAAAVMGVSAGSARTHYARAKARMAQLLGKEEL